jgi:hypothetical protein
MIDNIHCIKLYNGNTGKLLSENNIGPSGDSHSQILAPFKSSYESVNIAPGAILDIQVVEPVNNCRQFIFIKRTKQSLFMGRGFTANF